MKDIIETKQVDLAGKVVYLVVSSAAKVRVLPELIDQLLEFGVNIVVIPTPNATHLLSQLKIKQSEHVTIADGQRQLKFGKAQKQNKEASEESAIIVAPCTFNTLSKIACGITDSYALMLVATAIAKKTPVIVAPSYDATWHHPMNIPHIEKLQSWGVRVIWPDLEIDHITMVCPEKIVDTFHTTISKVKFTAHQFDNDTVRKVYGQAIKEYLPTFKEVGLRAAGDGLNYSIHGCMSVRISEKWMLITSTGTSLAHLEEDDVTLVDMAMSNKHKEIYWHGQKLPSSETPLHLSIYKSCPETHAVIHTHCPQITYNPNYMHLKTEAYVTYGNFEVIEPLRDILLANDGFGITRMHGEVVHGPTLINAYEKLRVYLPKREKVNVG
ncbi:MAG TPA: flavoprotein [Candidatus Saccharimonadales bacterium]|nr:flavoprotein [Candidatus Saccharimonadales bacterium]